MDCFKLVVNERKVYQRCARIFFKPVYVSFKF